MGSPKLGVGDYPYHKTRIESDISEVAVQQSLDKRKKSHE